MTDEALLRERFGFPGFRPGQREVLDALSKRKVALAVFPTGAGKSLCYQLPALRLDGLTLVISPLIALMKDQIDFLGGRGISAARLDPAGGKSGDLNEAERASSGSTPALRSLPDPSGGPRPA